MATTAAEVKTVKKKRRRIRPLTARQRDTVMFPILERFLAGEAAAHIAGEITAETRIEVTRERVYDIVREAVRRKLLLLTPPVEKQLTDVLRSYPNRGDIRVVHARGERANEHVSATGAEITYEVIKELARQRGKRAVVHVAFGIGRTTMHVVRHLAARLGADLSAPRIVVHAISPPFSLWHPLDTPLSAFGELYGAVPHVEFVNLEAPPFVPAAEYARVIRRKPIAAAFERAKEIDIVITSFADGGDPHGYLREYLTRFEPTAIEKLDASGWVGDVHLCPYTATGPFEIDAGIKPVTLFQLADLVALAGRPDKHVVLLCAPCTYCKELKRRALLPLLRRPELRAWNHLVVDYLTAFEMNAVDR